MTLTAQLDALERRIPQTTMWCRQNPEKRAAQRKRWKQHHRAKVNQLQRDYMKRHREKFKLRNQTERKENPLAVSARNVINKRLQRGTLVKPSRCQTCKKQSRLHAHHPNYRFPDKVIWLCSSCHWKVHHAAPLEEWDG